MKPYFLNMDFSSSEPAPAETFWGCAFGTHFLDVEDWQFRREMGRLCETYMKAEHELVGDSAVTAVTDTMVYLKRIDGKQWAMPRSIYDGKLGCYRNEIESFMDTHKTELGRCGGGRYGLAI